MNAPRKLRPAALALLVLAAGAARADDDAPASSDDAGLGQLLDSIPDIEQPAAEQPAEDAAPPPPREVTFSDYVRSVRQAVLAAWEPPAKFARKHPGLVARVLVQVDANGGITEVAMVRSSGEPKFDKAVLKALAALPGVPAPPPAYRDDAAHGLVVDVPARKR